MAGSFGRAKPNMVNALLTTFVGSRETAAGYKRRMISPFIHGRVALADASELIQRYGDDAGFEWYACARPGLPRAVVYRDSMAIPLIPLLSENFSRVAYVSSRRLDPAFIEREAPDIVIDEMVERAMLAPVATPMPEPAR
jgi:hypothetical protein